MNRHYFYILASKKNGTLYIGTTHNMARRIQEHRMNLIPGFSSQHDISILVHLEEYSLMSDAAAREKKLKKWNRAWKIQLIEERNPEWKDLSQYLLADCS